MLFAGSIFLLCAVTRSVLVYFVFNLGLGLANSGTRIMRITYFFNHIPNNIIGRASSVFHIINIMLRFSFISLFSLAWFSDGNNIVWAYAISAGFILISVVPLVLLYQELTKQE